MAVFAFQACKPKEELTYNNSNKANLKYFRQYVLPIESDFVSINYGRHLTITSFRFK